MTDAIITTAEAAAERLDLAARVTQVQQRMAAFGAVLEPVGAQNSPSGIGLMTLPGRTPSNS